MKTETIKQLQEMKRYHKEDSGFQFMTPFEYLGEFAERATNPLIRYSKELTNVNSDETKNTTYGRILIEDTIGEGALKSTVGLLIALDLGKPTIKAYKGSRVTACTNLCIFNAEEVFKVDIGHGFQSGVKKANQWLNEHAETFELHEGIYKRMENRSVKEETVNEFLGYAMNKTIADKLYLGTQAVIETHKNLISDKSPYHFEKSTTIWNLYNAMTQTITDKSDIFDEGDRALSAYSLVEDFFQFNS